ncbi:MAG: CocE/NonD family hydrolase [Deltaproteobacteria bacterium]|nr:CocE/NonD family hydrolase [Deltaproteobacteria bacterium]
MATSVRVDFNIPMKMRDGVTLRADIFRPDDNEKHPAIVVRTPYGKTYSHHSDYLSAHHAAANGYVFVVQDVRGRFMSEGEFIVTAEEGPDGYDTVENVAAESWCDGNVGMVGCSYLGRNQWVAAVENPPHLKAISPSVIGAGPLSEKRRSGVKELEQSLIWFADMAVDRLDKLGKAGHDVSEAMAMLMRARFDMREMFYHLPLKDLPVFKFADMAASFWERLARPIPETIKTEEDLFWPYHKVQVPCFLTGGWYDLDVGDLFTNFFNMQQKGGSALARENQYVLCGPWIHGARLPNYVAGINFGTFSSGAAGMTMERHITFFNKYLRGIEPPRPMAPVRYFLMGLNRWRNASAWPLPQTDWQRFYLRSKGKAHTLNGDGTLSRDLPAASEPADIYVYDPRFPVSSLGGRNLDMGSLAAGPLDQRPVEQRNDVLCYTTPAFKEDVEVTGPVVLHLFAATTVRDTDFVAKLIDVHPDGAAYNLAEGCIRARFRKGLFHEEFITPGEVYEYVIDMAATSNCFRRGHCLRIDITSSNFPRIDRNMNTGNPFGEDAEGIPAIQTIFHQADCASYIDLPVIPAQG